MPHWPKNVSELRAFLHIEPEVNGKLCCHAKPLTRNKSNCRNPINKSNRSRITSLILSLVNEKALTPAASEYLDELAFLIMCQGQQKHQDQGEARFEAWEEELALLSSHRRRRDGRTKGQRTGKGKDEVPPKCAHTSQGKTRTTEPKQHRPRTTSRHDVPKTPKPSPEPTSRPTVDHTFAPYSAGKTVFQINLEICKKLRKQLSANKPAQGSVYVYEFPRNHRVNDGSCSGFVKIGCSVDPIKRMEGVKNTCEYTPTLLCAFKMPHHALVESILQTQLHNVRRRESAGCPNCGIKHKEWFQISQRRAMAHVKAWTDWMHSNPYNHRGVLEEKWQMKLDRIDHSDARCWEWFFDDDDEEDDSDDSDDSSDSSDSDDTDDSSESDSEGFDTPDEDSDDDDITDGTDYSSEED